MESNKVSPVVSPTTQCDQNTHVDEIQQEFHTACRQGDTDRVKMLLNSDIDINSTVLGSTALYEAVKYRHFATVKVLLSKANPNIRNNHDLTPLHRSCLDRQFEMVELLVKSGECDLNAVSESAGSAIHIATMYLTRHILDFLLRSGADVNVQDKYKRAPIHVLGTATKSQNCDAVSDNSERVLHRLLTGGATVNIQDCNGQTPLHIYVNKELIGLSKILLENGANSNIQDKSGISVLHLACKRSESKLVHYLLEEGADPNLKERNHGETALHTSSRKNRQENLYLLLKYGANINAENSKGQTALHSACQNNSSVLILDCLLKCGADANLPDMDGNRPLHICAKYGHSEQVEKLLNFNARIDARDRQGRSPVYIACQQGHRATVQTLLDKGANLSITDIRGRSPLHQICGSGFVYVDLLTTLLNHEPNLITIADTEGKTPLHVACQAKLFNDQAIAILVSASHRVDSDTNNRDNQNSTAFDSMLRNCQQFLPFLSSGTEDAFTKQLESLKLLSDAGGTLENVEESILTSSNPELNNFLIRNLSQETRISTPLIERLMQIPENVHVLVDCGHRLDTNALFTIKETSFVELMSPPNLMIQCRNTIHRQLKKRRGSLKQGVGLLPIPHRLQKYLNFDY